MALIHSHTIMDRKLLSALLQQILHRIAINYYFVHVTILPIIRLIYMHFTAFISQVYVIVLCAMSINVYSNLS